MPVYYITSEVGTCLLNSKSNSDMQNTDGEIPEWNSGNTHQHTWTRFKLTVIKKLENIAIQPN